MKSICTLKSKLLWAKKKKAGQISHSKSISSYLQPLNENNRSI